MYYKKNKTKILKNFNYFKLSLLIIFLNLFFFRIIFSKKSFILYFYKTYIFKNLNFIKKQIQGKIQNIDKIYINIDFQTLNELNIRQK